MNNWILCCLSGLVIAAIVAIAIVVGTVIVVVGIIVFKRFVTCIQCIYFHKSLLKLEWNNSGYPLNIKPQVLSRFNTFQQSFAIAVVIVIV